VIQFRLFKSSTTIKRSFDLLLSLFGLLATWWLILFAWIFASLDTRKNGFFNQDRVGKDGRMFQVIKIRTMREIPGMYTTVTTGSDQRITSLGRFWRKTKIDELPGVCGQAGGKRPDCFNRAAGDYRPGYIEIPQ